MEEKTSQFLRGIVSIGTNLRSFWNEWVTRLGSKTVQFFGVTGWSAGRLGR